MSVLNFFHRGLNRAISPLGLSLKKVEPTPWRRPLSTNVAVAGFTIDIPTKNPLSRLYVTNPGYTSFLGRLASLIAARYPDAVAIDVGANIGDTACIIRSGASLPVICVEGDKTSFAYLQKNISQFDRCMAHRIFLGEKSGPFTASIEKKGWNNTIIPSESAAGEVLEMLTLDDFVSQSCQGNIKLLKIDTEGFDCAIIRSGQKIIESFKPVISFEYNRDNMAALKENGLQTLQILRELGYTGLVVHDCGGRYFDTLVLEDWHHIENLHHYADGISSAVYYFDYTLFHETDSDIFRQFSESENANRRTPTVR